MRNPCMWKKASGCHPCMFFIHQDTVGLEGLDFVFPAHNGLDNRVKEPQEAWMCSESQSPQHGQCPTNMRGRQPGRWEAQARIERAVLTRERGHCFEKLILQWFDALDERWLVLVYLCCVLGLELLGTCELPASYLISAFETSAYRNTK